MSCLKKKKLYIKIDYIINSFYLKDKFDIDEITILILIIFETIINVEFKNIFLKKNFIRNKWIYINKNKKTKIILKYCPKIFI